MVCWCAGAMVCWGARLVIFMEGDARSVCASSRAILPSNLANDADAAAIKARYVLTLFMRE